MIAKHKVSASSNPANVDFKGELGTDGKVEIVIGNQGIEFPDIMEAKRFLDMIYGLLNNFEFLYDQHERRYVKK